MDDELSVKKVIRAEEITEILKSFEAHHPVLYDDFASFFNYVGFIKNKEVVIANLQNLKDVIFHCEYPVSVSAVHFDIVNHLLFVYLVNNRLVIISPSSGQIENSSCTR